MTKPKGIATMTDEQLRGLLDSFPGSLLAFGEAYHDAVLELIEARAAIDRIKQRIAWLGDNDPEFGRDDINAKLLSIIDPTAKGK